MGIMTKREWQRTDVENLIKSYQTYDMLWDVKSDGYKNKALKRAAIQELSKQFGRSTDEITRKLHNLRSQFNSELKKLRTHTGSGGQTTGTSGGGSGRRSRGNAVAVDNGFVSKWPFFTQLHFLRNVSKIDMSLEVESMKAEAEEFQNPTTYGSDAETDNADQIEQLYMNSQSEEEQYAMQIPSAAQKVPNIVYNPTKKRKSDELDPDQMVLIPEKPVFSPRMPFLQQQPSTGDQFDIFGLYVASELKNLSSQYLRKKLKRKIQEVVLEICEEDERLASPLYPINALHHA